MPPKRAAKIDNFVEEYLNSARRELERALPDGATAGPDGSLLGRRSGGHVVGGHDNPARQEQE